MPWPDSCRSLTVGEGHVVTTSHVTAIAAVGVTMTLADVTQQSRNAHGVVDSHAEIEVCHVSCLGINKRQKPTRRLAGKGMLRPEVSSEK